MAYATYTKEMLANFTGRPAASYSPYAENSAIPQAQLLFKMATCLASPDDLTTDEKQLVDYAILSAADAIYLAQPYAEVMANPFQSEGIGSYNYSKMAQAVSMGLPTGIMWFDEAVNRVGVCDITDGLAMSGGIEVFEHDGITVGTSGLTANTRFLSPDDIDSSIAFGFDPNRGTIVHVQG